MISRNDSSDMYEPSVMSPVSKNEWAANVLFNKSVNLRKQGKVEEALAVYDEIIERFGDDDCSYDFSSVHSRVVGALFNKGVALRQQGKAGEALAVFDEVVRHFGHDDSLRGTVAIAKAFLNTKGNPIPGIPFINVPCAMPEAEDPGIDAVALAAHCGLCDIHKRHDIHALPESARRKLIAQIESTLNSLNHYHDRKLSAYNHVVAGFVGIFGRLQNVDLNPEPDLPESEGEQAPHESSSMESARVIPFHLHDQAGTQVNRFKAIEKAARFADATFSKVCACLRKTVGELETIIEREGEDFSRYSAGNRRVVFRSVHLAQLLKTLFDTPILDEKGNLLFSGRKRIEGIAVVLDDEQTS